MPGLIAFLNALLGLVVTGMGVFGGASFLYGSFHWISGDHQRGRSWIIGALIGIGIALCAQALGSTIAALPHA